MSFKYTPLNDAEIKNLKSLAKTGSEQSVRNWQVEALINELEDLKKENENLKELLQKIRDTEDRAKEVTPPIYSLADLIEHLERIVEEMKALASMSEGTISFDDLRNSLDVDEEEGTANA